MILTSVVRATHQGESHGGAYLVDLATGDAQLVMDWNDQRISWEGRGGDRGLRGIAFHDGRILLAASDEIFVFDQQFRRVGSYTNRYLKHCHEIVVSGATLHVTSTGFDSILALDLGSGRWTEGHCLRYTRLDLVHKKLGGRPVPSYRRFDPEAAGGPAPADTTHVNSVWVEGDTVFACGTRLGRLLAIRDGRVSSYAVTPFHTHNARPFGDEVILNHTGSDRLCVLDRAGNVREHYAILRPDPGTLTHVQPAEKARPAFGRGLAVLGDGLIAGGSSPAAISLYQRGTSDPVRRLSLTNDVRNAVHGLELWPYDGAAV